MMSWVQLILPLFAGLALGAAFFGGLWLTVTRGLGSSKAGIWFLVSNILRTCMSATGFYFMARIGFPELAASLAGFLSSRVIVGRLVTFSAGFRGG